MTTATGLRENSVASAAETSLRIIRPSCVTAMKNVKIHLEFHFLIFNKFPWGGDPCNITIQYDICFIHYLYTFLYMA
jgi:hypothetical protein